MNPYAAGANKFKYRKDREPTNPDPSSNEFQPFVVRTTQEGEFIDIGTEHLTPIRLSNPDTNVLGATWGDWAAASVDGFSVDMLRYPEILDNNKNGLLDDDDVQYWESEGDTPLGINQVIVFFPDVSYSGVATGEAFYLNTVDHYISFIIEGTQSGKDIINNMFSEIDIVNNSGVSEEVSSAIREYVKDMFMIMPA